MHKTFRMKNLDEQNLKVQERKAIDAACVMLKERFPVEKVIVFGSKARVDNDEGSVIDLLLLTSRPIHWRERKAVIYALFEMKMAYHVGISILDASVSEWNEGPFSVLPIYDDISREGVIA